MKIAIIGMGVAGVSVLSAMTKHPIFQKHEIILFDKPQTFGTGLPYQPDSSIILLNQTADTMSMEQNDRLDFVRWWKSIKGIIIAKRNIYQGLCMGNMFVKNWKKQSRY